MMYVVKRDGSQDKIYEVVTTLPSGLEFLCRGVSVGARDLPERDTPHKSLKLVRLVPEDDGDGYFHGASLYQDWSDLVRDL